MTPQDAIATYHRPHAHEKEGHVYSVWEDGEITIEKCGSLFDQRTLHMLEPGCPAKAWDVSLFPIQSTSHGRIFCDNDKDASTFRAIILEESKA